MTRVLFLLALSVGPLSTTPYGTPAMGLAPDGGQVELAVKPDGTLLISGQVPPVYTDGGVPAVATNTNVDTTATRTPTAALAGRGSVTCQNQGPDTIWCSTSPTVTLGHGMAVFSWGTYAANLPASIPIYCITDLTQLDGGNTFCQETP